MTKWCCNAQTSRRHIANTSPYDRRMLRNHFSTNRRLVGDEAPIYHRLIADQAQTGRRKVAKSSRPFLRETNRRTVGNHSAMKIRSLHDLLEFNETSERPNQSRPAFCACSKDCLQSISFCDLSDTSIKHETLCDCQFCGRKVISSQSRCLCAGVLEHREIPYFVWWVCPIPFHALYLYAESNKSKSTGFVIS